MDFVNETTGYMTGSDSNFTVHLFKTTNAGANWNPVGTTNLNAFINFTDENTGYRMSNSKFSKTINGGLTWTDYTIASGFSTFNFPQFAGSTGWISGYNGTGSALYRTQNGGETWAMINNREPDDFKFKNANEGYATINGIPLKTVNGGANWTPYSFASNNYLYGVELFNNTPVFLDFTDRYFKPTGVIDTSKWVSTGEITNAVIKTITHAPNGEVYANGDFAVSGNTIAFSSSHYSQGNGVAGGSGTYTFINGNMEILLNLPNAELWKIVLRRR
jgi:photosystem II stability/assembly factor-like uncharacterized protein